MNAEIEKFVAGLPGLRTGLQGETDTMKIEQQAQTRAFLIQSFGSVRVGTYTALRSGLL